MEIEYPKMLYKVADDFTMQIPLSQPQQAELDSLIRSCREGDQQAAQIAYERLAAKLRGLGLDVSGMPASLNSGALGEIEMMLSRLGYAVRAVDNPTDEQNARVEGWGDYN